MRLIKQRRERFPFIFYLRSELCLIESDFLIGELLRQNFHPLVTEKIKAFRRKCIKSV